MNFKSIILILITLSGELMAQSAPQVLAAGKELNVLYRHEATVKVFAHTRGFGLAYRRGKHLSAKTKSLLEIEFLNYKHPKEIEVKGSEESAKQFIYGKLNGVGILRIGTGIQNVIFKRSDRKSVEIRCSYILGVGIAFAKPYYVLVYRGTGSQRGTQAVKYDSDKLTQDSIAGHGPWVNGLDEMQIYPNFNAKFNLSFEYAPFSNWVRAIEVGASFDYFPRALPIMAKNPPEYFVATLYIGFVIGKKWF